jgi:hypothetical protein
VTNSSVQYTPVPELDLRQRPTSHTPHPSTHPSTHLSTFPVEVNARAPGTTAIWPTLLASGIDYSALHLLLALPPSLVCVKRETSASIFHAICRSVKKQHPLNLVFIPVIHGGTFVQQTAHLRVALGYYCFKKGMQVLDPRERHRRTRIRSLLLGVS